jgi:tripartite-type tricarboxylate transporter receptor subunit TctC
MAAPELVARLAGQGAEPAVSTPAELTERLADDLKRWAGIVKASGATID